MRAILTYHSIDASASPISVSEAVFAEHVRWFASGGVRVVPLEEISAGGDEGDKVAITFDDGFENFGTVAAPRLAEHGIPATVFVVSEHVGRENDWGIGDISGIPRLPLLDWESLGALAEGRTEVGAHTRRHPALAGIGGAALEDEIAGCVERIRAELGRTPQSFAYPYGSIDAAAVTKVRGSFVRACTTELRELHRDDDASLLPRIDMYYFRAPGQLEMWGRPSFRRRLWLRAQGRRVRGMMSFARKPA